MNTILFDGPERKNFLPFTYTRPVAELRIGILTLREKWEKFLNCKTSTKTEKYLSEKWSLKTAKENLYINPTFLPDEKLVKQIKSLKTEEKLIWENAVIAFVAKEENSDFTAFKSVEAKEKPLHIAYSHDLFSKNEEAISRDFQLLTKGRKSAEIPEDVFVKNKENIFIEEGAKLTNCSLNAENGFIYIGKNAEVMEGVLVRGSLALCNNSYLNMGAKIYGATTIGPYSKVGGEVNNSVIIGYSNKGHEGFLGNSVLGEWCNIGADSNTSNLKNNYAEVRIWDYEAERFSSTGLQFCGLMMGDHSKCGINTMFNTGTVVGVSANIYGAGFPRNFIPSFTWGGSSKMITYRINKVFEVAEKVMARRAIDFSEKDKKILEYIFEETQKYRRD